MELEVLEMYEAGMSLHGFEVKTLRAGQGSLSGARVLVRGGEAFLVGATIPPYQQKNAPEGYDPERTRRLLIRLASAAQIVTPALGPSFGVAPAGTWMCKSFLP